MTATCVSAIKGRVLRAIKLDTCGNPVTGASSAMIVAEGFISVAPKPTYEDGQEFVQKNAAGGLCVNQKDDPQLKRVDLEIKVCTLDPDLIVAMTGDRLLSSGATGIGVAFSSEQVTARWSLEVWQDVAGKCSASGVRYVYWCWPNVGGAKVGDFMINNGALEFTITGETEEVGADWGDLPTLLPPNDYIGTSAPLVSPEHYAYAVTSIAPPTAACGAVLLT